MEIIYRRLKRGDENSYRRLHLESLKTFPDFFGTRYEEQSKVEKLQFEAAIETESEDNFMFGAFAGEQLVGIAGFRRGDRPKTRHRGELVQVFVNPGFHGQKIGESLIREVLAASFALPGVEILELSAVATNPVQKLYEKLGFESYVVRQNYFKIDGKSWDQRFMELAKEKYLSENHVLPGEDQTDTPRGSNA